MADSDNKLPIRSTKTKPQLAAVASFMDGSIFPSSGFYMPNPYDAFNQSIGLNPEKLVVPRDYHAVARMCYDFYVRGGLVGTVIDRLTELSVTDIRNGQRKTTDEANQYFQAILHKQPSRLMRFIRMMALEYWITGMVLPKVTWVDVKGKDLSPDIARQNKTFWVPVIDAYPSTMVSIFWAGWGKKAYWLQMSKEDITLIKTRGGKDPVKQAIFEEWQTNYPSFVEDVMNGTNKFRLTDTDPILRKENSLTPYPTPFLEKVLEALIFKQQMRRMDFSVCARVVNAILLVKEGSDEFPLTEETRGNLDELKAQILARSNNPLLMERLFILFTDHTTQMEWITPDVSALLSKDKYEQVNEEIIEGLGFPKILIVGEARNASAADVSTWAIQPQMEEFRSMCTEWLIDIYDEAKERNGFRTIPAPSFTPIKLQDFVKTAAVFAQAFREGNMSRTTRDEMMGLDFETELELMMDERKLMAKLPEDFPEMPYNIQVPPANAGQGGFQYTSRNPGQPGTQKTPVNRKNTGVSLPDQAPLSRTHQPRKSTTQNDHQRAAEMVATGEIILKSDEEVIELINKIAEARNMKIDVSDL